MNARSLQEDLLSIPGVEGAEVEGSADRPAGLRIRIAEGADQQAVGGAIRRVLTSHGLGTDTRLPGEGAADGAADAGDAPAPTPVADAEPEAAAEAEPAQAAVAVAAGEEEVSAVIDLTDDEPADDEPAHDGPFAAATPDVDDATADEDALVAAVAADDAPPEEAVDVDDLDAVSEPEPSHESPAAAATPRREPAPAATSAAAVAHAVGTGVARLGSVAVEEGRDGIVVTVAASDGSQISQAAASTEGGVETAVVRATARLALPDAPEASVIEIEDRRVEGVDIVMIVLDVDGRKMAGSAVVGAGRAFALARATWSALSM